MNPIIEFPLTGFISLECSIQMLRIIQSVMKFEAAVQKTSEESINNITWAGISFGWNTNILMILTDLPAYLGRQRYEL